MRPQTVLHIISCYENVQNSYSITCPLFKATIPYYKPSLKVASLISRKSEKQLHLSHFKAIWLKKTQKTFINFTYSCRAENFLQYYVKTFWKFTVAAKQRVAEKKLIGSIFFQEKFETLNSLHSHGYNFFVWKLFAKIITPRDRRQEKLSIGAKFKWIGQ